MFYINICIIGFAFLCTKAICFRSNGYNHSKKNDTVKLYSIPPRPDLKETLTLQPDPFTTEDPTTQARAFLKSDLFSESNGKIFYYALLVSEACLEEPASNGTWNENNSTKWPDLPNWESAASDTGGTRMYQATPMEWQPFANLINPDVIIRASFILGTGENDGNYTNGPLKPNTEYSLKIRAFTVNGYQDTDIIHFKTLDHLPFGMIITIFILIFLATLSTMLIGISGKGFFNNISSCLRFKRKSPLSSPKPTDLSPKRFLKRSRKVLSFPSRLSNEYHLLGTLNAVATTPCLHKQRIETT